MLAQKTILVLFSLAGGITVGTATAAFIAVLQIVPRLCQITETGKNLKVYEKIIALSFTLSVFSYFLEYSFKLPKLSTSIIGLIFGVFTGLLSSALAEVLNVIPVLSKKLKVKDYLKPLIWALLTGKVVGSLYFWLYLN